MKGSEKILECLVAVCVILAALSAAPYIVLHAGHDCAGDEHCAVCVQLQRAADILRQTDISVLRLTLLTGFFVSPGIPAAFAVPASAVSLKVRMNT